MGREGPRDMKFATSSLPLLSMAVIEDSVCCSNVCTQCSYVCIYYNDVWHLNNIGTNLVINVHIAFIYVNSAEIYDYKTVKCSMCDPYTDNIYIFDDHCNQNIMNWTLWTFIDI